MKKLIIRTAFLFSVTTLLTGCIAAIGNDSHHRGGGTLGQQLLDLQKAKEAGVITEGEFQTEKARLLDKK